MGKSLEELAKLVDGTISGDPSVRLVGAADILDAGEGDVVFAETPRLLAEAQRSLASAIIVYQDAPNSGKPIIRVGNPRLAFARVLEVFSNEKRREPGIHPTCLIGEGSTIGENPSIGFNAYIGRNTAIGKNVCIYPLAFIDDNVVLGDDCVIYPFVSILDKSVIGNRVTIHSSSVVGSDGFGYTKAGSAHYKIPQIGSVVIGDDVEIGANATIDRARTGKTEIGSGSKIDNLVQIAHNVTIGENSIICAQVGIAGSSQIGANCTLAGQAGVKDHIKVGSNSVVCAQSGIIGDVDNGSILSGYPARPHKEQMRLHAAQQRLPHLLHVIRDLERRVKELEEQSK
jgi:UDP-3-O-[3-hydroxymyristoyl] glucosamine N-acyltransferase